MLGIIGAMDQEVSILKEKMEVKKIDKRASMEFYVGILNGKEVVIVKCGVGKVNAAVCTQILADCYQVEAVINTGVAGSLRAEINIVTLLFQQMHCSMIWMQQDLGMNRLRFH